LTPRRPGVSRWPCLIRLPPLSDHAPVIDDLAAFGHALAQALDAGDVAALQIRLKDRPEAVIAAAVDVLVADRRAAATWRDILNDRPDLAAS